MGRKVGVGHEKTWELGDMYDMKGISGLLFYRNPVLADQQARDLDALIARDGTAQLPPLAGVPIAIKV